MAGVTDAVYRSICKKYGAALTCTEMVSMAGLYYQPKASKELMIKEKGAGPYVIQIFGSDPKMMSEMAKKYCMDYDIIDINMGCPAPKIVKGGAGSALMKTPDLAREIVERVVGETGKTVTCKIRSGWDDDSINAVEFATLMQDAGAKCIAVHARTRQLYYSGEADWSLIKKVKKSIDVPLIGNGDIKTAIDAKKMIDETGCDGIMVGRAAQGRPFLFEQIKTYLEKGELIEKPSLEKRMNDVLEHANGLLEIYPEYNAVMMMRKHLTWYIKGEKNAASLRNEAVKVKTIEDIRVFTQSVLEQLKIST
jgi:tRNA-dihydrouridine synthase B